MSFIHYKYSFGSCIYVLLLHQDILLCLTLPPWSLRLNQTACSLQHVSVHMHPHPSPRTDSVETGGVCGTLRGSRPGWSTARISITQRWKTWLQLHCWAAHHIFMAFPERVGRLPVRQASWEQYSEMQHGFLVYMTTQVLSLKVEITLKFGSHIMDWHRYLVCKYIRWVLLNFPSCPIVWKYRFVGLAAINSGCQDTGMITQITATMHRAREIDWPADDRQATRSVWRFPQWATGLLGLWTLQYLNTDKKKKKKLLLTSAVMFPSWWRVIITRVAVNLSGDGPLFCAWNIVGIWRRWCYRETKQSP